MSPLVASSSNLVGVDTIMLLLIVILIAFPIWMIVDCINVSDRGKVTQ